MSTEKQPNDGGPAFPALITLNPQYVGLSVRDYFAAKALAVVGQGAKADSREGIEMLVKTLAELSYQMADAMLEARKQ